MPHRRVRVGRWPSCADRGHWHGHSGPTDSDSDSDSDSDGESSAKWSLDRPRHSRRLQPDAPALRGSARRTGTAWVSPTHRHCVSQPDAPALRRSARGRIGIVSVRVSPPYPHCAAGQPAAPGLLPGCRTGSARDSSPPSPRPDTQRLSFRLPVCARGSLAAPPGRAAGRRSGHWTRAGLAGGSSCPTFRQLARRCHTDPTCPGPAGRPVCHRAGCWELGFRRSLVPRPRPGHIGLPTLLRLLLRNGADDIRFIQR